MNPLFDDRVRRIIPRWRDAATTARLGELGSLKAQQYRFSPIALREKLGDWITSPSLFVATDIVGTALLVESADHPIVQEAARTILAHNSGASDVARRGAIQILQVGTTDDAWSPAMTTRAEIYRRIHDIRRTLSDDLRNAIAWVDLSYLYTLAGRPKKAEHAMKMAVALAPHNRHVLRSATRRHVHNHDPEAALWLLRGSDRTPHDPWLIAAEIGVSGLLGLSPRFAKKGLAAAASSSFAAGDLTEVASALGTLEAEHGNRQKAKKLFGISLQDPNDNVLAQAAWAARALQAVDIDPANLNVPFSYEARARISFRKREFSDALREGASWFNDQRFSVGAAAFASYVAAVVLARHEEAIAILQTALVANPVDWTLNNNLAFSLASLGRIAEARVAFATISSEEENPSRHGVWLATSGLLAFRGGDPATGQRRYEESMMVFHEHQLLAAEAVAAVFKAREELHANLETGAASLRHAKELAASAGAPELDTLIAQLDSDPPEQRSLPT